MTEGGPRPTVAVVVFPGSNDDRDAQLALERLVRFAYSTGGAARRGPVTLRAADVERLRRSLAKTPELAEALGLEPA